MELITGRVWVFGDNIDTDQILPGYAMAEPFDKLATFAMAGSLMPNFSQLVAKGDIIVAGKNFGCGSSREQAPVALKGVGVSLVIAESFARIYRRNSINIGLPCLMANFQGLVQTGDEILVNLGAGTIKLKKQVIQGTPLSENVLGTLNAGGLINRVRQELGVTQGRE